MNDSKISTGQLPGESTKAYNAFRTYAEMGPDRSQEAVGMKLSKSRQLLSRWSARFHWRNRIIQWDAEHADVQKGAEEQAALEVARTREQRRQQVQDSAWMMFERLRDKANEMLAFPVGRRTVTEKHKDGSEKTTIVEPVRWRFSDLAKLVEVADALGRLANGMVTRHTALTTPDGGPLPAATGDVGFVVHIHTGTASRNDPLQKELPDKYEVIDVSGT